MAFEGDIIGSKDSEFYAEYWHEEQLLHVLIKTPRWSSDDWRELNSDEWMEIKSSTRPIETYLRYYQLKHGDPRNRHVHKSPAAKKPTLEEAAASRRREEANRPMGCGMKLFLIWLGFTGLVLLASLVGSLLKR